MTDLASILGRWSIVSVDADEAHPPSHRVDLDCRDGPDGLHGVVIGRFRDIEIPLQTLTFDGTTLRLQMTPPPGKPIEALPFLVMTLTDGRFEGQWDMPAAKDPHLKLIRTRVI